MQHIIRDRNVFTNFQPCSQAINPNNETCLVTCAVSLTCATWLMYAHSFSFDPPLNQDTCLHYITSREDLLPVVPSKGDITNMHPNWSLADLLVV